MTDTIFVSGVIHHSSQNGEPTVCATLVAQTCEIVRAGSRPFAWGSGSITSCTHFHGRKTKSQNSVAQFEWKSEWHSVFVQTMRRSRPSLGGFYPVQQLFELGGVDERVSPLPLVVVAARGKRLRRQASLLLVPQRLPHLTLQGERLEVQQNLGRLQGVHFNTVVMLESTWNKQKLGQVRTFSPF